MFLPIFISFAGSKWVSGNFLYINCFGSVSLRCSYVIEHVTCVSNYVFWYLRVLQELYSDLTDLHITNPWTRLLRVFFFCYFCCCCCIFRYPQLIPSIMTLFQSVQNLKTILYMSSSVENYKFPVGTKDNPAMTCKELMDIDNIQNGAHH